MNIIFSNYLYHLLAILIDICEYNNHQKIKNSNIEYAQETKTGTVYKGYVIYDIFYYNTDFYFFILNDFSTIAQ